MSDQPQGTGPSTPQGTGAPAALDEDRIAQIAAQVVNAAFSARGKKLKEDITVELGGRFDSLTKKLEEMTAAPQGKRKKDGETDTADPVQNGMARQLAEMKAQLDESAKKLADADARQKKSALKQRAVEELGKAGLTDPVRASLALRAAIEAKLGHDEETGEPVYYENEHSVVDLATGIRAWMKTDEAKIFLPPTGARGSGDRPGQGGPRSTNGAPQEATDLDIGMGLISLANGMPVVG
jgi:hypothetical protein